MPEAAVQTPRLPVPSGGDVRIATPRAPILPGPDPEAQLAAAQNKLCPWISGIPHSLPALQEFRRMLVTESEDRPVLRNAAHFSHFAASADGTFIVYAKDQAFAQSVADAAPRLYDQLSLEWFNGKTPRPDDPLIISACEDASAGAGGATSMIYDPQKKNKVTFLGCVLQGSGERILDSVLPHELTHALMAHHFDCLMPRWADEGMSCMPEHPSESIKMQRGAEDLIRNNRARPVQEILATTVYPPGDQLLPFYHQGYSLSKFLVMRGEQIERIEGDNVVLTGKQRFGKFLGAVVQADYDTQKVEGALHTLYGFKTLKDFDDSWKLWVRKASDPQLSLTTVTSSGNASVMYQYQPPPAAAQATVGRVPAR